MMRIDNLPVGRGVAVTEAVNRLVAGNTQRASHGGTVICGCVIYGDGHQLMIRGPQVG